MAHELKHGHGISENVPTPQEIDRDELPPALLKVVSEMKAEIDALWAFVKNAERAAEPWESDALLADIDKRKASARKILKGE